MKLKTSIATLVIGLAAHNAGAAGYPTQSVRALGTTNPEYVLADSIGKTLYTFDPDPTDGNAPACNGKCSEIWPPVLLNDEEAESTVAPYSVVTRTTGLKQLALNGAPLYTYFLDRVAGDVLGDGVGGVWHVVPQEVTIAGCRLGDFVENNSLNPSINISGMSYAPKCLRIKKGIQLTLPANGVHPLSATVDVLGFKNPLAELGVINTNKTVTFNKAGIFGYFCVRHGDANGGGMAGAIEVVE
jgi:predicted lipoprotein with Yx(FWY)xxD motif